MKKMEFFDLLYKIDAKVFSKRDQCVMKKAQEVEKAKDMGQ